MHCGAAVVAASLGARATEITLTVSPDGSWTGETRLDWTRLDPFARDTVAHAGGAALDLFATGAVTAKAKTGGDDPARLAQARLNANRDLVDELVRALLDPNPPTIAGEHLRGILEQSRATPRRPPRVVRRDDLLAVAALLAGLFLTFWLKNAGDGGPEAWQVALGLIGVYAVVLGVVAIRGLRRGRWRYQGPGETP